MSSQGKHLDPKFCCNLYYHIRKFLARKMLPIINFKVKIEKIFEKILLFLSLSTYYQYFLFLV